MVHVRRELAPGEFVSDYSAVVVMLLPFHDVQSAGETGSPRQICEISSENTSPLTDSELLKRAKII